MYTAALLGAAAAAAWGAAASAPAQKSADAKKKPKGGYVAEKAPVSTTEVDSEAVISQAVQQLQDAQANRMLPPKVRQELQGLLQETQSLGETVGSAEYGRPAGGAVGLQGRKARPASLRGGPSVVHEEAGQTASLVDLSGAPEPDSRRSGASAAGAPLSPQLPGPGSRAAPIYDPPAAQKAIFDLESRKARERLLRDPGDEDALETLAVSELAAGRYPESVELADRAVAQNPSNADAYMLRAMAKEAMGDRQGKIEDARQAARLDPGRHGTRAAAAEAGAKLFDPASAESWGLLGKMAEPPPAETGFPWALLLGLVVAIAAAGGAIGAKVIWADLPAESRQRLVEFLRPSERGRRPPPTGSGMGTGTATPMPQRIFSPLRPGGRLGSKYELIRALGRDGTVEVWKAHDTLLDRDVLLKRLYVGRDSGELDLRRQESKQAATLHHPNIAELFEIAELPEGLFAVYEYASGKSLASIMKAKGSLSLRQARDVLVPVCRALEHAHRRGVIHGGLSPERIMLTRQGYVKVMDFVLARTMTGGGSEYAAPEIKRGAPTPASDVYAAGMILHEMLAGSLPGEGSWEPAGLVATLLEKSLDLDVRTRLASAREMLEELRRLPAETMPPRALTPKPTTTDHEELLTSEPNEEGLLAAGGAVGDEDPDSPLIDPGPPTHPTNPG